MSLTASGPPQILADVLRTLAEGASAQPERPFVTLTFAQSLHAKISGTGGRQLILSGEESMRMTHWMRMMHDDVLIGVNTALGDNPQLNVHHLPFPTQNAHFQHYHHPRPIILDSQLCILPTCKLLANAAKGRGMQPWVISVPPPKADGFFTEDGTEERVREWEERRTALEEAGAHHSCQA